MNAADPHGLVPIVRLADAFVYASHVCLVFERLVPDPLVIPRSLSDDPGGTLACTCLRLRR